MYLGKHFTSDLSAGPNVCVLEPVFFIGPVVQGWSGQWFGGAFGPRQVLFGAEMYLGKHFTSDLSAGPNVCVLEPVFFIGPVVQGWSGQWFGGAFGPPPLLSSALMYLGKHFTSDLSAGPNVCVLEPVFFIGPVVQGW